MPKGPKLLKLAPAAPPYLNLAISLPDGSVISQAMLSPFEFSSGKCGYFINGRLSLPGVVWADTGDPVEFMTNDQMVAIKSNEHVVPDSD